MSKVSFVSDGYKLAGNLFVPSGEVKKLAFLLIQGWTGHQNIATAQVLARAGFTAMTYDMRGNGESEGDIAEFSRADFIKDAVVAYDYFKQQVGNDTAIGVIGGSFGSYSGVLLSEQREVYCLSLRVPATYPDEGFDEPQLAQKNGSNDFGEWRKKKLSYSENHAFKALHAFTGRVQIIEAQADKLVPSQAPRNYADAVTDKSKLVYEVMPNAPHRLVNEQLQTDYERLLLTWITSLPDPR